MSLFSALEMNEVQVRDRYINRIEHGSLDRQTRTSIQNNQTKKNKINEKQKLKKAGTKQKKTKAKTWNTK